MLHQYPDWWYERPVTLVTELSTAILAEDLGLFGELLNNNSHVAQNQPINGHFFKVIITKILLSFSENIDEYIEILIKLPEFDVKNDINKQLIFAILEDNV